MSQLLIDRLGWDVLDAFVRPLVYLTGMHETALRYSRGRWEQFGAVGVRLLYIDIRTNFTMGARSAIASAVPAWVRPSV